MSITKNVNKNYIKYNPSTYLRNFKLLNKFVENRQNFLLELKLPKKIFENSELIDYGSGAGLNTLPYNLMGAKCTLLEYDKNSVNFSKNLFHKFSKKKYKIIKTDLFKFKTKKKFDFVVSNGVSMVTKNPLLNLKICVKSLKKNGFFILGLADTNGYFQRNLQRYILYSISKNEKEIIKYSKILFKDHLNRASKFSGRTIEEIIADTYLVPKMETLSLMDVLSFFKKNNLKLYSFYGNLNPINFLNLEKKSQFKLVNNENKIKKSSKIEKNLYLHDLQNFSLSNNKDYNLNNAMYEKINFLNKNLNKITNSINDLNFSAKNKNKDIKIKDIKDLKQQIVNVEKLDIIDKKHQLTFLNELQALILIIRNVNDSDEKKFLKIKKKLLKSQHLLKGLNGTGMTYFVGYKY